MSSPRPPATTSMLRVGRSTPRPPRPSWSPSMSTVSCPPTSPRADRVLTSPLPSRRSAPIMVAVYVDGVLSANATANALRTDVGAAFPTLGSNHGFAVTVPVAAGGSHLVDVYAIDSTGNGNNPLLARHAVTVDTESFGS